MENVTKFIEALSDAKAGKGERMVIKGLDMNGNEIEEVYDPKEIAEFLNSKPLTVIVVKPSDPPTP